MEIPYTAKLIPNYTSSEDAPPYQNSHFQDFYGNPCVSHISLVYHFTEEERNY